MKRMFKGGSRRLLCAVAAIAVALAGCFAPEVTVLRQPHQVMALDGKRPTIYLFLDRMDSSQWYLDMRTPKGNLLLKAGPAIVASYTEGLGGFFYVIRISRYNDYMAYVDPFSMNFEGEAMIMEGGGSARVRMRIRHIIPITKVRGGLVEDIPLDLTLEETLAYNGEESLRRECSRLLGTLLSRVEDSIAGYLISNDAPGKYYIPEK